MSLATWRSILFVDLDGTLLQTDVLWESVAELIRRRPLLVLALPFWLLQGKAMLKANIAKHVTLSTATLPYRESILTYVTEHKSIGGTVVLATATHKDPAHAIARNFPNMFDEVLASDGTTNLTGMRKLEAMQLHARGEPFDYIGNEHRDAPIWRACGRAMVVAPSEGDAIYLAGSVDVAQYFQSDSYNTATYVKAMRIHQWAKNVLVAVPFFLAHRELSSLSVAFMVLGFLAFSFCASAVYVLNDLVDLESDRLHPRKRNRPFASGLLPIPIGLALVPSLLITAFLASFPLGWHFQLTLVVYMVLTSLYSFVLKRFPLIDVLTLAGLYTFRLFAGSVALNVPLSQWMLSFSLFFFLSLAFVKRFTETSVMASEGRTFVSGRGYHTEDRDILLSAGVSSALLSVLVFLLYISSADVTRLYHYPSLLWCVGPMLLFWLLRVWLKARRGEMHDDPLVFMLRDRVSGLIGVVIAALVSIAAFLPVKP